ncbi:hypothetical protein ACOMICROBIO_LMKGKHOH_02186 [Vibrio sp. B1FIG11]|uniref:hypothetical protein n=1 Tax=Vibrio sp. B1FIG11 TaxID=2751177 RepID=UPI001AFB9375|nr:hypothetical protein [Vibrio sp. B1FIG11]CAD7806809.1 hypothetical protein ACOMICROBIO_LMKGKHOH_02186 [Vibrio sp. B1FIG11]CAE6902760.1 hypothetical protein ACOMICROBIO_LMKGKHOH_02186 [Vibrio sp. B1FIG11]
MQTNTNVFLPKWLWIVVIVQISLVTFFSLGTAFEPSSFLPNVEKLNYVTQLYITRNLTAVVGLVVAVLLRSRIALLTMLIVRLTTDLSDITSVFLFDVEVIKSSVPMVVILLVLPALASVYWLAVHKK